MSVTPAFTVADLNTHDLKIRGFKAYATDTAVSPAPAFARRDFYKIALVSGRCTVHYADRSIELLGNNLLFTNPRIPYATELHSGALTGFACVFTEDFMRAGDRSESLQHSPLFQIGGTPAFQLSKQQATFVAGIFQKILDEQCTNYLFKNDLIRTYLQLLIHEALRLQPFTHFVQPKNAASRIANLFLELLERLFPLEDPSQVVPLKTAQDFAAQLAVHVNHLNRAVKEVTGKPTTVHIAERIISEAKALLHHTDWDVATIAYGLGFEYASYFTSFFKKHTGFTPLAFRQAS